MTVGITVRGHAPVWVQESPEDGMVALECECGRSWTRDRLADCAVAHERHQADMQRLFNDKNSKEARRG